MMFPLTLMIGVVVFTVQIVLCFSRIRMVYKWLPAALGGLTEVLLGVVIFIDANIQMQAYGVAFAAYIIGLIVLIWIGCALLAWLCFGIIQLIKKQKNNRKMFRKNT